MESGLPARWPTTSGTTKKEAESFLFPDCFSPSCSAKSRIIAPFLRLVKKFSESGHVPARSTVPSPPAATPRCRRHADWHGEGGAYLDGQAQVIRWRSGRKPILTHVPIQPHICRII